MCCLARLSEKSFWNVAIEYENRFVSSELLEVSQRISQGHAGHVREHDSRRKLINNVPRWINFQRAKFLDLVDFVIPSSRAQFSNDKVSVCRSFRFSL